MPPTTQSNLADNDALLALIGPDGLDYWAAIASSQDAALQAARNAKLRLRPWQSLLSLPTPPWLIEDFIQERAIHIISGPSGSMKTWLALQAMLAINHGTPLLGSMPSTQGGVIYLGADSTDWDQAAQLRSILLAEGLRPDSPPESESFHLDLGFFLNNPQHLKAISEVIKAFNIRAMIFDVMLYAHQGLDENSNSDMAKLHLAAKYLRDTCGIAIIFLHHWPHGAQRSRGAGTITQAIEHEYHMLPRDGQIILRRAKLRGEAPWQELALELQLKNGGKHLTPVAPLPNIILTALATGPRTRQDLLNIAATHNLTEAWLSTKLSRLKSQGLIISPSRATYALKDPA